MPPIPQQNVNAEGLSERKDNISYLVEFIKFAFRQPRTQLVIAARVQKNSKRQQAHLLHGNV